MSSTTTVLLCGVGGQGTVLAADVLAHVALACNYEVKVSEIHGMAQRGGAVTTVVRFGQHVASMVSDIGECDCVVSFETTEALRNISFLAKDGALFVSDETIKPLPVACGNASMPPSAIKRLKELSAKLIPADNLARNAGSAKAQNIVLLGALSNVLPFDGATWERIIAERVPEKFREVNVAAFRAGAAYEKSEENKEHS